MQPAESHWRDAQGKNQPPQGGHKPHYRLEAELIAGVRSRDPEAAGVLYRRYREPMLRFAIALLHERHTAEDVFHEAFTKTITAIRNGRGPKDTLGPYLSCAVRTVASDWRTHSQREVPVSATILHQQADTNDGPRELPDPAAINLALTAFQSLPLRWQTVLWYTEIDNQPPRRIAPLLGISPNAVSALLLRARKGLRAAYQSGAQEETRRPYRKEAHRARTGRPSLSVSP